MPDDELRFFKLVPCEERTAFRLLSPSQDLIADAELVGSNTSVVIAVDLRHFDEEYAGVLVPFLQLPVSVAWVDFQREKDGRYRYLSHDGRDASLGVAGLAQGIDDDVRVRLTDHGEALATRYGLVLRGWARPEPISAAEYDGGDSVRWGAGPTVRWVQARTRESYEVPASDWIYAGSTPAFMYGEVFAFYAPTTGRLRLIVETS